MSHLILEFMKKNNYIILCCTIVFALFAASCSERHEIPNLNYVREELFVSDQQQFQFMDTTDYFLEILCSLSLPSKIKYLQCDKIEYVNGYFYILDVERNNTILVFDSVGNYISQIGQRGRASNEYIDNPTNFCVNPENNQVMVYERNAHRIHTFNQNGKQVKLQTLKLWPYDVGTLFNGNYVGAFDYKEAGKGLQLGVFDKEENITLPVLNLDETHVFLHNERTFRTVGQQLYHIPNFSDSVLVFKEDTLYKVVHLNFQSPFITQEIIHETNGGNLDRYHKFEGITSISNYYETDNYITFMYTYNNLQIKCIINKQNNKQCSFASAPFKGLFPGHNYIIDGENILWLITEDDIVDLKYALQYDAVQKELAQTHSLIRDIINEKYALPVILRIKTNWL